MKLQRRIGPFDVVVECRDDLRDQAAGLLNKLAELNAKGPALRDGTVVQFGWAPLKLREQGNALVVCEPDFGGDPFHDYVPTVDTTLRILSEQVALSNRLGVAGYDVYFDDKLIMAQGCLHMRDIYLERMAVETAHDSGWYIGPVGGGTDQPAEELESIFVYQLLQQRPELIKVLILPPGYLVIFHDDEITAIFTASGKNVWLI
jgi:hypothetical protein